MEIVHIVGARPQFIKAAPVVRAFQRRGAGHLLVHTGQHYDREMSEVFFKELDLPEPDLNLEVGSGTHGVQTARMLERIEAALLKRRPDWVVVYGDTNSTLAGALAACKLGLRVAHIESGLRSYNRSMPEEHNRVLADHCADLLLCPTQTAVDNLRREGVRARIELVGDTMYDAILSFLPRARKPAFADKLKLKPQAYLLATIHRPYNTDNPEALMALVDALSAAGEPVVFPTHPRTRARLTEFAPDFASRASTIYFVPPVGYLEMLWLERNARLILTDSGGVQKEAYFLARPCVTLRPETEWVETVQAGWNRLARGKDEILQAVAGDSWPTGSPPPLFGDGRAADRIAEALSKVPKA